MTAQTTMAAEPARTPTPSRVIPIVRLLAAVCIFAISLLAVFPAPAIPLWLLAIGATEFGHWFCLLPLALLMIGRRRGGLQLLGTLLLLAAFGLFLSPAMRAAMASPQVRREINEAFPLPPSEAAVESSAKPPFLLRNLWLGPKVDPMPIETFTFIDHPGISLHLRFYRSSKPQAPCVVVLHTGGWYNGTPDEFVDFNAHIARRGYAVAAIEYRFAPEWQWPAQRDDVADALHYLRDRAETLGIDPQRFVLLGRSAGGQIAEAVAYGNHDPAIRGVIAFYSPADMYLAYRYARADDILNSLKLLRDFLGGSPWEHPGNFASASGIGLVGSDSPPTLLLHGERDELVWVLQSQRLAAHLKSAGVPSDLVQFDWATHAFDYNLNGPAGQIAVWAVDHFLDYATQERK